MKPPSGPALTKVTVGLVHHPVTNADGEIITTSVTTLDVHDLARTCRTYGIARLGIVTPLPSQQTLTRRLITHWLTGYGAGVNPSRKEALTGVEVVDSIEDLMHNAQFEESRPLVVVTSAEPSAKAIKYEEARESIAGAPSALILFGTGHGLAPQVMEGADIRLEPIHGPSDFNHLPVRGAAAIILDRLFGRR